MISCFFPIQISADNGCDIGVLLGISFATTFMPDAADEMAVVGCCACTTYNDDTFPPDWQKEAGFITAHYPPGECLVVHTVKQKLKFAIKY